MQQQQLGTTSDAMSAPSSDGVNEPFSIPTWSPSADGGPHRPTGEILRHPRKTPRTPEQFDSHRPLTVFNLMQVIIIND